MKHYFATLLLLLACGTAAARSVYPFNEGWRFFFKSENSSDNARHVTLPHTWNTDTGGTGLFLETTANYQNDFYGMPEWAAKRIFVKFYGVQSVANLFVNGSYVGEHRGGATAFTFEITDKIKIGADNALMVVVSNNSRPDVLPTSTDMNLYGGIYREAELIVTDRTAISPLFLGTEGVLVKQTSVSHDRAEGEATVHLTSAGGGSACQVTLEITAPDGRKVFTRNQRAKLDGKAVVIPFSFDKPALWSTASPSLYRVTVRTEADDMRDEVTVRTGFRTIRTSPSEGFLLNGERIPVRGVTLYHDNAISGGALTAEDYDSDLAQIRTLGANAIRSAVTPHAQYLYDRCDEQGLLVWVDMPLHRAPFLGDVAYYATPQFEENGRQQLREIIAQNYNHPSVAMWGIYSLLWTRGDNVIPYLRTLNKTAHEMDPSRPTVACSDQNGEINFVTDLIVWQQNVGWERGSTDDVKVWRDMLRKSWSHLSSGVCFGGSGFIGHKSYTAKAAPRSNWMPMERQTRFHEEYMRNLQNDSLFWGVWINNMYDYGSVRRPYGVNGAGLVTLNRRECKDAFYLYKSLWNKREPTLYLTDKRRRLRDSQRQAFKVYSSQGAPLLLVNQDTVKLNEYAPCQYLSDTVTLLGDVRVTVSAGALRDSVELRVGNVLKPKRNPAPRRTTSPQTTN